MIRIEYGRDIVEELRGLIGFTHIGENVSLKHEVIERAIAEIQFLRGMASAVTKGESFSDIKKGAGR